MDRETFVTTVRKFKAFINEISETQKRDKRIMRMPRKTAEQRAAVQAEVLKYHPSPYNWDVSIVQSRVAARKMEITALLNQYLLFRGKTSVHKTAGYGESYRFAYAKVRKEVVDRCCIALDANSHRLSTGKTT